MKIHFSNPMEEGELEEAYNRGMIKIQDLIHNRYYKGHCRNASIARWNSQEGMFVYKRFKWVSSFMEDIEHPENDDGYDLFIPLKLIERNVCLRCWRIITEDEELEGSTRCVTCAAEKCL